MEREPEFLEGTSGSSMTEAVVCASCPETYHDRIAELCLRHQVQKAFGKAVYIERTKWKRLGSRREAKVVMATVIKAQTLKSNKALILGIAGGKNGEVEMARQPALAGAIKSEMASPEVRVRVELMEIQEFVERYPEVPSRTSKSTKERGKPKDSHVCPEGMDRALNDLARIKSASDVGDKSLRLVKVQSENSW